VTDRDRVQAHTSPAATEAIRRRTEERVAYYAAHPELIPERLRALDREWDVERRLELMSSSMTIFGLVLGITRGWRWFLLPLAVQAFFLQHAVQGWCPPLPTLRRLGVRTQAEIDEERYALKALRGDFANLPLGAESPLNVVAALHAVRQVRSR